MEVKEIIAWAAVIIFVVLGIVFFLRQFGVI
jgi:hypothetical protein